MRRSGFRTRDCAGLWRRNLSRSRVLLLGVIAVAAIISVASTTSAYLMLPSPALDIWAAPALPPLGYTKFCLRYPNDCKTSGIDFRRRNILLTVQRWNELNFINRRTNNAIVPQPREEWLLAPSTGDCKDYAITKRHELLLRGWPSRALLLSEVALASGEHHLVLVVRVKGADLVLDNLKDDVRSVAATLGEYSWVKIQIPQNPNFWNKVRLLQLE
jgi:predicted transglutaminase-like cysteine proteinase